MRLLFMYIKPLKQLFTVLFVVMIAVVIVGYLSEYHVLEQDIYFNGVATDAINLLIVICIFWLVQLSHLVIKTYFFLSLGLWLWTTGLLFDLLDEVLFQPKWIGIYVEDMFRTSGMLVTGYGLFLAMQNLAQAHQQLSKELITDDLTKVANRRYFYQYVKNNESKPYSIFIVDIDHFKSINDEFGHDIGDHVLKELAVLFASEFKGDAIFARIGGEEFAIYYPSTCMADITAITQRLLTLASTVDVAATRKLSVSIGGSIKQADDSLIEVMKRADQALYKAKNSGRGRFEIT